MSTEPAANPDPTPDSELSAVAIAPPIGSAAFVRQERRSRDLILDYALGVSILGLIPIKGLYSAKLLVTAALLLKMMRDIGKLSGFRKGQGPLAIAGNLFGGLGAFAMAFTAWLTFYGLGIFIPYLQGLSLAAALFTLTWGIGQATKQFYASAYERD